MGRGNLKQSIDDNGYWYNPLMRTHQEFFPFILDYTHWPRMHELLIGKKVASGSDSDSPNSNSPKLRIRKFGKFHYSDSSSMYCLHILERVIYPSFLEKIEQHEFYVTAMLKYSPVASASQMTFPNPFLINSCLCMKFQT